MALYKGPELRNEEMSLYIHVSSSHWLQAAPRNGVDPFKQRQLGIEEIQDSGERKMMNLPALQVAEGASASVPKAGDVLAAMPQHSL